MIKREEALQYHAGERAGKIEIKASKPCLGPREMRLAYLPGAAFPVREIVADPSASYRYTSRGNLVAVVTNGTAVPGLGDVGPAAAKPMQEGVALLFKRLADIDVFDLELATTEPDRFVEAVQMLEPTFGGINLKDLRAPEGLEIYDRLRSALSIPVFHENLYGTAIVAMAALLNALDLTDKDIRAIRVVICGTGTVGLGCARLLKCLGVPADNLLLYDVHGLIHPERQDLNPYQAAFARAHAAKDLADGLKGADVFLGASTGGVLTQDMIRSMARYPVVFAMAAPEPEITYEAARASRRDVIVGTSNAQDPNALVDLLSFPYILRGALDVQASTITEGMMLAAARALADLAREDVIEEVCRAYGYDTFTFGPEYLLPKPIDPRVLMRESAAVARQAIEEGVARKKTDPAGYEGVLTERLGTQRQVMRQMILKARQAAPRIVLPWGSHEATLRASAILLDEGIASPILLGTEEEVQATAERLGLDLGGATVIDPNRSPRTAGYAEEYFRLRARRGVTREAAQRRMVNPRYYGALMLHQGDADMMIAGVTSKYADAVRTVLEVIGPEPGVRRISSAHLVLRPRDVFVVADCAINIDPDAQDLAEIALQAAQVARLLGLEPRVAMLSYSNFGSVDLPGTRKVREATRLVRERSPGLRIEGEIGPATALNAEFRQRRFPFAELDLDANVLVFPDLQSGNLAVNLLRLLGDAMTVGPMLLGTRRPVHLLQDGFSAEDVVNLAAIAAVKMASES